MRADLRTRKLVRHFGVRDLKNEETDPHKMVLLTLVVTKGKILSYTLLGFCIQLLNSVFLGLKS